MSRRHDCSPYYERGRLCPVSEAQLFAFRRLGEGWTRREVAEEEGVPRATLDTRLKAGRARLRAASVDDAMQVLTDAGWMPPREPPDLMPLLLNYVHVKEAYDMAPQDDRDDMLVAALKDFCAAEARNPPCTWVGGGSHDGPVADVHGRLLCAAHGAEYAKARGDRERRGPQYRIPR